MSETAFEKQVKHHLSMFTAPDYTAKGDAVNFFKINHQQAIPILEKLAAQGSKVAGEMLSIAQNASKPKPNKRSFMENNPDLF